MNTTTGDWNSMKRAVWGGIFLTAIMFCGATAFAEEKPCVEPPVVFLDNGTTTIERPPCPQPGLRAPDLVEVNDVDPALALEIRYSTPDNFTKKQVYTQARAFLQRPAAEALKRAHERVQKQGYGMIVYDGYRPWSVTKFFWDITPQEKKDYVGDPAKGSRHNRGCAVDLTLCDLATSKPVVMPTDYDDFTTRAHARYEGVTGAPRKHRDILREAMEAEGYKVLDEEWWHFDYKEWKKYPIMNVRFEELE